MSVFQGKEVYQWPEFQALLTRLGIEDRPRRRSVTITVSYDAVVQVGETYLALKPDEPSPPEPTEKI